MKPLQPGPHLDQLIRTTRVHHVTLSQMADVKANMMLTVSSIVIPIAAAHLNDPTLYWALVTGISFCVLTILFAAYAAMPKLSLRQGGSRIETYPDSPAFNILFFPDFVRMDYDTYEETMSDLMSDPTRAYQAQLKEIYGMGLYLARKKYRFLKLAYISFLTGLFASGAVYVAGSILHLVEEGAQ